MEQLLENRSWYLVVDENRECPSAHVTFNSASNQRELNCVKNQSVDVNHHNSMGDNRIN